MSIYLAVGVTTLLAALVLTPCAARLARVMGWLDKPGVRKIHGKPVAYLGGAAIFSALCLGFLVLLALARDPAGSLAALDVRMLSVVGGAALLFIVGLIDDIHNIRPRVKLTAQVVAAVAVCASGITIDKIQIAEGLLIEFGGMSYIVTILWIVGITNAVNLIDGMDGLATGLSSVACATLGVIAYQAGLHTAVVLMAGLLGALLGFLPFNLNPAKIFLGDAGSMLLGFLLSTTAVLCVAKSATVIGVAIPLVALGIPILDTLFSMIRRVLEGRSLFSGDRSHIHHRLLALGFGQKRIVALLCAETACAVSLALFFSNAYPSVRIVILLAVFGLHILLFRAVGAVRFRASFSGISRLLGAARVATHERLDIDDVDLRFREAGTLSDWWNAVCEAASLLGFTHMRLPAGQIGAGAKDLTWRSGNTTTPTPVESIVMSIPVHCQSPAEPLLLHVEMHSAKSLDEAGRHMASFCSLMDRHSSVAHLVVTPKRKRTRKRATSSVTTAQVSTSGSIS